MKTVTLLLFACISLWSFAQNCSLTIFNNNGQQFFVIMNGIRQNSIPQTNVKIGGMTTGSYAVKLIFADGKTGDIDKNIFFNEPGDYLGRVVFKGKKRKLQYFGVADGSQQIPAGGTSVIYRPSDQSVYSDQLGSSVPNNGASGSAAINANNSNGTQSNSSVNAGTINTPAPSNGTATIGTNAGNTNGNAVVNGSTAVNPNAGNGTVGMNTSTTVSDPAMNSGNMGINVQINVSDPAIGGNGQSTATSTTTTTSSSTTTQNGQVVNDSHNYQQTTSVTQNGQTTTTQTSGYGNSNQTVNINGTAVQSGQTPAGLTAYSGCTALLIDGEGFVAQLKKEAFEEDKLTKINAELAGKCLNSGQAYNIVAVLTFDADKLEVSKFLYDRMTDKVNGTKLLGLLTFEGDQETLKTYMQTHP